MINVIKKINMECSICGEIHDVEFCEETVSNEVKGCNVSYKEEYLRCTKYSSENTFMIKGMWNKALLNKIDAYRELNNLLTSKEIKNIRNKYNLTQSDLAFLMGIGEVTITRYETKQIQEPSNDNILREINNNAIFTLKLLEKNKEKFSDKRYIEISDCVKNIIDLETKKYLKEQEILSEYIKYDTESMYNGNCVLDIEKLKNVLAYITEGMESVKKVVLMKILWYIDSYSFKKYEKAITGLVYAHKPFGALPIAYNELLELPSIKYNIIFSEDGNEEYQISKNRDYKIVNLTKKEKEIIDTVVNKFKNFRSREIVEYMHKEKAYTNTKDDEIISFSFAKYLNEF